MTCVTKIDHRQLYFQSGNMTTRDITIHTPGSDAACGIKLDLKKKYLIGGKVHLKFFHLVIQKLNLIAKH